MARSVAFYRDVLGMPLKFETPKWTEFATEGATFALHKSEEPALSRDRQGMEAAGSCRAGFQVASLDAFHARMIEKSVRCEQEPTETFGADREVRRSRRAGILCKRTASLLTGFIMTVWREDSSRSFGNRYHALACES